MAQTGLQHGDECYVSVRINKALAADFVITTVSKSEVLADIYSDPDVDLITVYEALKAALGAVAYQLEQPRLKRLLKERIEQLKRESEEGEWDNPPPPSTDFEV